MRALNGLYPFFSFPCFFVFNENAVKCTGSLLLFSVRETRSPQQLFGLQLSLPLFSTHFPPVFQLYPATR
jgi:hypothetical protein